MFSGFRVEFDELDFSKEWLDYYEIEGKNHLEIQKRNYDKSMQSYLDGENLSARKITKGWFPEMDVDIFVSHSGKDSKEANALAGWLHDKFELKCFIDSNVWSTVDTLINALNNTTYNKNPSWENCCQIFGHTYMMLSIALLKMIDKAEAVFLVNAGNALPEKNKTYSPWIFSEITGTNIIRIKPLAAYRKYESYKPHRSEERMQAIYEYCCISYDLDLSNLKKLDAHDFQNWMKEKKNYEKPLDALYAVTDYDDVLKTTMNLAECCSDTAERIFEAWNPALTVQESERSRQLILESFGECERPQRCMKKCGKRCPFCFDDCI